MINDVQEIEARLAFTISGHDDPPLDRLIRKAGDDTGPLWRTLQKIRDRL